MSLDLTTIAPSPAGQLGDIELLALALDRSTSAAAILMNRFGGIHGLARASHHDLIVARVPPRRAQQLHAALELGRRTLTRPLQRGATLDDARTAEQLMWSKLSHRAQEELHVVGVDVRQRIVVEFIAAIGGIAEVPIDPRDVFRPLLQENAHAAIVVHNHPSGSIEPSGSDVSLTRQLAAAGEIVGVKLLDHIIVARDGVYSFARHGRM
ncbi:MAG: JAB domain-containing protein [Polyangia bacterium]